MTIVLDTSVLMAAFISPGMCTEVMERAVRLHRLALSGHILGEFSRHLMERNKRKPHWGSLASGRLSRSFAPRLQFPSCSNNAIALIEAPPEKHA